MKKIPLTERLWFIILLFLIGPLLFYVPSIIAITFLLQRQHDFPNLKPEEVEAFENKVKEADDTLDKAKEEADNVIEKAKEDATRIVADAEKEGLERQKQIKENVKDLEAQKEELNAFLKENADEALFKQTTVDFTDNITSSEIKNELALVVTSEKELVKSGEAVIDQGANSKTEFNKQSRQLLRAFNAEADYYTSNVTLKNVDNYRNKLARTFETLNKLFEVDRVQLSQELLKTKLKQLDIIYQYKRQIEIEKELLKAQKEEIREQQKVEKEIQNQKRKLEKEERQFNNEMTKLLKYLNAANNDIERQIYADKISELEDKIKVLEKDKENVLQRESNTRAGFVYIISNIGSFGENIYKIGMTRRLEPMDRISELSSASVPFPFDVHALIFSEDAPALETTLHNYFRDKEVNKVNPRKEFFNVDLKEIKEVVHKEFNNTVHFTDLAVAEQYRESIKLASE